MSELNNMVHFTMQSKGGAGKSVVSYFLAQWVKNNDQQSLIIDTDPQNKTLGSFKALSATELEITKKKGADTRIDKGAFDQLVSEVLESEYSSVIDTGSGEFMYLNSYLVENDIPAFMLEEGKNMVIHCVVNYGQAQNETFRCLAGLAANYPETPIVVWENEYFEEATTPLLKTKFIKDLGENILGVVTLPKLDEDTVGKDLGKALKSCLTFNEVKDSTDFNLLNTRRLLKVKDGVFDQLDRMFDFSDTSEWVKT